MAGIALFAFASLLGGLATSEIWLILTRGLQGVGAAIASPTAWSLIATNFPEGQPRNRALGVYAATSGGGGALGLLLGGILTDLVSWRWIFFIDGVVVLADQIPLGLRRPYAARDGEGPVQASSTVSPSGVAQQLPVHFPQCCPLAAPLFTLWSCGE